MATSGSTDINATQLDIINGAFRLLGLVGVGETRSPEEIDNASSALNLLLKELQADNIGLWLDRTVTLFLGKGTQSYTIGPSGNHATLTPLDTELSADIASDETDITVDAITGFSDGDYIGVELDNGEMQWTTINGTPSGSTIVLTDALTDDAAENNTVVGYTTKSLRPLEIKNIRLRKSSTSEIPMEMVSQNEYMLVTNKTSEGSPSIAYYDPQLTNGVLYIWPTTSTVDSRIVFTAKYPIEIFDDWTDSPDFPEEWLMTLRYCLAETLALEYPDDTIDEKRLQKIIYGALTRRDKLRRYDTENTSIIFAPDIAGYY